MNQSLLLYFVNWPAHQILALYRHCSAQKSFSYFCHKIKSAPDGFRSKLMKQSLYYFSKLGPHTKFQLSRCTVAPTGAFLAFQLLSKVPQQMALSKNKPRHPVCHGNSSLHTKQHPNQAISKPTYSRTTWIAHNPYPMLQWKSGGPRFARTSNNKVGSSWCLKSLSNHFPLKQNKSAIFRFQLH